MADSKKESVCCCVLDGLSGLEVKRNCGLDRDITAHQDAVLYCATACADIVKQQLAVFVQILVFRQHLSGD